MFFLWDNLVSSCDSAARRESTDFGNMKEVGVALVINGPSTPTFTGLPLTLVLHSQHYASDTEKSLKGVKF